jgi:hypothetical protein
MIIDNLDTTFDRLEIIRVYNSSINSASPTIDIIYDDVIPLNGIYPFTYDGYEPAIPITINEVLVAGVSFNKVKSIASKNNILFYLNTSESNFDLDYDARAFRWQWSNSDAISTGTMNWANTLPETDNDINPNQSSITVNSVDPYIYQQYVGSGVPILGGNGIINPVTSVPNISYTFDYEGVTYGFENDWKKLAWGAWQDLEFLSSEDITANIHKILAVLYRPVTEMKDTKYKIEPYKSEEIEERAEIMKLVPVSIWLGASVFFLEIVNIYITSIKNSLELTLTIQERTTKAWKMMPKWIQKVLPLDFISPSLTGSQKKMLQNLIK